MQDNNNDQTYEQLISGQNENVDKMLTIRYLTDGECALIPKSGGFVGMELDGTDYPRVNFIRAFPTKAPDEYISVRDKENKELGMLRYLTDLSPEKQALVTSQLNLRYFAPTVEKIVDISEENGAIYWTVMTDRGQCRFVTFFGGNFVAYISDTRIMITDMHGNRFEIPDTGKLTEAELRKLSVYV